MVVIYAEKASLAKEIAHALNAGARETPTNDKRIGLWKLKFDNQDAVIVHGQGHLVKLAKPEIYDAKYKAWDLDVYPCVPNDFKLEVKEDTKELFSVVKEYFGKADYIINATDADREGELIFYYIYQALNCNKKWKRAWIEDLTDEKIRYAFSHLKDGEEMHSLQLAGQARSIFDWLFGINFTVAFTSKFSNNAGVLACGRVQTPTLSLIVNREREINSFTKSKFYKVEATFETVDGAKYLGEYEKTFDNKQTATDFVNSLGNEGLIKSKETKLKTENAPLLFNSTQLQVACSKQLDWDLKKSVKVMQDLYEAKYMSYPRTASEHLTVEMKDEIKRTIVSLMEIKEYSGYKIFENDYNEFTSRHFDNSKVGSHPAITPTLKVPKSLSDIGTEDLQKLYDILAKSLIRIVYPKAKIEQSKVTTIVDNHEFKSTGSVIVNAGWYAVDAMPDKTKELPQLSENQKVKASYKIKEGETSPPKRYTEADLISAMELAGQKIEDEEARTLMKLQKKGLGTDATRASIVESLFKRAYIVKKGKTIYPTEKGVYIINALAVEELKSAEMTGELEKELNDIELSKMDYNKFITKIKDLTVKWYEEILNFSANAYTEKSSLCPICGKRLVKGKNNIFCSNYKNGCKLRIPYEICGKKLTKNQIDMLINSKRTNVIKNFVSKNNKNFDASIELDATGNVKFNFPATKKRTKK